MRVKFLLMSLLIIFAIGYFSMNNASMQTPNPDLYTIEVSANPNIILMGGDTSIITAQLYYNGALASTSGITVHFESSNPAAGSLPSSTTTNSNGAASQTLTSGSAGSTNVRAYIDFGNSVIKEDTVQVTVLGYGTITGVVRDRNGNGIPNATVKLMTGDQLYSSPENPQMASSINAGKYTFNRIPYGQYTVTAVKADASGTNHQASSSVNLNAGSVTIDVTLSDYPVSAAATPTPAPTPAPTPTTAPTTTPTTSPTATPTVAPASNPSDNTAPITTINLTGVSSSNDVYTSNVICTLSAQENPGGSGVKVIQYSFDGGAWNNYTNPFIVTQPGVTTVFYKAMDNNGNTEVAQVKSITISGSSSASPTQKTPAPSMSATIVALGVVAMLLALAAKRNKE